MPRAALSESEVEEFRETLCQSATRLFALHGYDGVTMRALATDLGCSPMTPYRYFENKAEIFLAVRMASFARFASALERATEDNPHHPARLPALARAYVAFALEQPHAYRIMFELDQATSPGFNLNLDLRSWNVMFSAVEEAVALGALSGNPLVLAHLYWSGIHGIVALHLSGMLVLGTELDELVDAFVERGTGKAANSNTTSDFIKAPPTLLESD
ncbi:MAG: AcrR family transcriptional regulator [Myxococcota bacterium]|jgi:AcrR family transcriptional regulator